MHAYGNTAKNKNINKNITQQQKILKEKSFEGLFSLKVQLAST